MNEYLVIIPTYNEKQNLPGLVREILGFRGFDVLVVDDASPDGTADAVKELFADEPRVSLLEREGRQGLGTAYIAGFKWGLSRTYSYFIEMDADGSHDPSSLPAFREEMEKGFDLVIGSRYVGGTISVVGWDFHRLLLSKFGTFYASRILGIRMTDMTSGFRCYSRRALEAIGLDRVMSNGYSFQIEMLYLVTRKGFKVGEISIIFYERRTGSSKMNNSIVREAAMLPWRLRFAEAREYVSRRLLGKGR